ncbi:DUF1176 domain-containing protein [Stenotrophomonas sp. TWI809]|uniref:DUF1176 domain-containing protein n=1 Tax=Stenotrophomonas sp. TWI809 TaxID=3136796 RepID=UPI00320A48EB
MRGCSFPCGRGPISCGAQQPLPRTPAGHPPNAHAAGPGQRGWHGAGRLHTPGALLRKGNRPEATVLPAVPVPVVRQAALVATRPGDAALAGSAALRAALKTSLAPDACDVLVSGERVEPLTVRRLSADKLLVSTQCWMGAYNVGEGYWVTNDRAPFNPQLVATSGSDEDEGSIHAAHKIRGLGDCWSSDSWTWDAAGSYIPPMPPPGCAGWSRPAAPGTCRSW